MTGGGGKETVGVALLNWNGADLTIACIASLLRGGLAPERIVVVDNASTDGSAAIQDNAARSGLIPPSGE